MSGDLDGLVAPHVGARGAFSSRCLLPELMDDPALPAAEHRRALAGLARINLVSAAAASLRRPLAHLCASLPAGRPVRVLDVATGGGDVPVRLARWARRRRLPLYIDGCDVHPGAVAIAQGRAARHAVPVRFFTHDALRDGIPPGYDAVISCLFLHHLADAQATHLLAAMGEAASHLVAVNDLLRSPLAYAVAWVGTRVLSASPVVHHDGPLSVRAAFTLEEAGALAAAAGLHGARLRWQWPFRFLLTWRRP
jgi:SAM-dependent methyltransferase